MTSRPIMLTRFLVVPAGKEFREALHPRDRRGRFARKPGGAGAAAMTDKEFAARQQWVAKTIRQTRSTHATENTHQHNGVWDPARDRAHREIARDLYAAAARVPTEGKAVVAGGLGGAGKTTTLRDHAGINPDDYFTINPDDIKEELARRGMIPEVPGHPDLSPMERAALVHYESGRIADLVADMAYRDRRNLIWDITMSSPRVLEDRLAELQQHGYSEATAVFVDIPVETSVARALDRYRRGVDAWHRGEGFGGRYVPPDVIRGQRGRGGRTINRETFDQLRDRFARWSVYDNSVHGRPPQLVDASHNGDEDNDEEVT
ncbi:zeta toxin family protein [Micromonospora sp. STR1s_5]|nr:zeta toxin family protein [Micromonospora sp. STR1s_5]